MNLILNSKAPKYPMKRKVITISQDKCAVQ